jgi:hypothetical protein
MANQRAAGKKLTTLWLTELEKSILLVLAKKAGMNVSDFLKRPISDEINNNPHKYKAE